MLLLSLRNCGVTLCANLDTDIFLACGVSFARPPSGLCQMFVAGQLIGDCRGYLSGSQQRYKREGPRKQAQPGHHPSAEYISKGTMSTKPEHSNVKKKRL
jgi:hypothetical protein